MSSPAELMALGMPNTQANSLGSDTATGVAAAGSSSQTAATKLTAAFNEIATAAANSGVMLTAFSDFHLIFNGGASPVLVYPPVGSFMNGSLNASYSVTNGKSAFFFRSGIRYIGHLSA
jgi:hypothetical protein